MDAIDRKILAHLQRDGRLTLTELSRLVQLSVSRCQRRVRDMEAAGVIEGYCTRINRPAVGLNFDVIAFATLARPDAIVEFDAALRDVPEVIEAERLFGEPDYMIRIATRDRESYQRLYEETLSRLPGLQSLNSTFVMTQVIAPRQLPLETG